MNNSPRIIHIIEIEEDDDEEEDGFQYQFLIWPICILMLIIVTAFIVNFRDPTFFPMIISMITALGG